MRTSCPRAQQPQPAVAHRTRLTWIVRTSSTSEAMRICRRASDSACCRISGLRLPRRRQCCRSTPAGFQGTPGGIFNTDFLGTGQVGHPLPKADELKLRHDVAASAITTSTMSAPSCGQIGVGGLTTAVNNYNSSIGGSASNPSWAERSSIAACLRWPSCKLWVAWLLLSVGLFPGQVGLGWLKAFDLEFSWVGHAFNEKLAITPSVSVFNLFNLSNFDSAANALGRATQRRHGLHQRHAHKQAALTNRCRYRRICLRRAAHG